MTVKDEAMTTELCLWLVNNETYYDLIKELLPCSYEDFRETMEYNGIEKIGDIDLCNKELDTKELDEVIKNIVEEATEEF